MLPGKTFTVNDILAIAKRRRWMILVPFALGLLAVPVIAPRIADLYRSETLIMIIPQRVPDSYVKSTVTQTVEDRLPAISDQIMSRSRLEKIVLDFNLYQQERQQAPMEDVLTRMRSDVGPISIRQGERSFRVGFTNPDPVTAQKVAARLATLFIDENSAERESQAENTNVFLESQLEEAKQRLLQHERKLEEYKRNHSGELPSQQESNLRVIQSTQLLLQSLSESINRASERRLLIERQLVDARTLPIAAPPPSSVGNQPASVIGLSAAQQLEAERAKLVALRQRYSEEHPDVRTAQKLIQQLEVKAEEEAKRPAPDRPKMMTREEQEREKKARELEAELAVIDRQLDTNHAEEGRLRAVIADYQRKVEAVPARESELVELTRDYEVLKKQCDSLLLRREDSKLAANLERRQIGEQFRVLDAATLPERPVNRIKRLGIVFAVAIVGLLLGLSAAALLEVLDSSFSREDEIARLLRLPVLANVPVIASDAERQRLRRRRIMTDVVGASVFVGSVATVAVWGFLQL